MCKKKGTGCCFASLTQVHSTALRSHKLSQRFDFICKKWSWRCVHRWWSTGMYICYGSPHSLWQADDVCWPASFSQRPDTLTCTLIVRSEAQGSKNRSLARILVMPCKQRPTYTSCSTKHRGAFVYPPPSPSAYLVTKAMSAKISDDCGTLLEKSFFNAVLAT